MSVYQFNTTASVLAWVMSQEPPVSQMTLTDEQEALPCSVDCQPTIRVAGNRNGIALQLAEGEVRS